MRNRSAAGLQAKVTIAIAAASLAVILSIIYLCVTYQRKFLIEQFQTSANCLIDAVSSAILYPMSIGDQQAVQQQLNEFGKKQNQVNVFVFGRDKQVAYTSQPEAKKTDLSKATSSPALSQALNKMVNGEEFPEHGFEEQVAGKNYLTILRPLYNEKNCQECHGASNPIRGGLMVRQSSDVLLANLHSLRNISILIGLGGCGAIIMLLYVLISGLAVRPITTALKELMGVSEEMANGSRSLSTLGQHLAEGASEQAAAIQETSSSLEEITATAKQNMENSGQSKDLAAEAHQIIENANQSLKDLTGSMHQISEASGATQKIVKTIEEIAFQTNLLALNAAVEAARANEAGAGFAIVAEEVRNLAIRATEAAKNTGDLIKDTAQKVEAGSVLAEKTNEDFQQVGSIMAKSAGLVEDIAAASREQAKGIGQINKAVAELDQVAQQNTANAEESAAVSEEMSTQAGQVRMVVNNLANLMEGKKNRRGRL